MNTSILKRWTGLGISIAVALFVFLLTQTLMQASAQGDGKLPEAQEEQETTEEEAGFRERERFLSGQTFPLAEMTLPERVAPEESQNTSLLYIENVGQFDTKARFQLRGGQGTIHFTDDAVWISLLEPAQDLDSICLPDENFSSGCDLSTSSEDGQLTVERDTSTSTRRGVHLKLSFVGANPQPNIVGFNPLPTTISYFMGNDPAEWRPDVPVYGGIRYEEVYPGVDIEYISLNGVWYPRINAQSQADLAAIELQVEGANSQSITEEGNLRLETEIGVVTLPLFNLVDLKPDRLSKPVLNGQVVLQPFHIGNFSQPSSGVNGLIYSTFLGGSDIDSILDISVDGNGSAYVTGFTDSTDFPTSPGPYQTNQVDRDVFISKLDHTGSNLLYSTYLGGDETETAESIAVDKNGFVYITGRATGDFPTTSGAFDENHNGNQDGFVTKLSSSGSSLIYSTYLGGSEIDAGLGIAINSVDEAYVTGFTSSSNFTTTTGAYSTTIGGFDDEYTNVLWG